MYNNVIYKTEGTVPQYFKCLLPRALEGNLRERVGYVFEKISDFQIFEPLQRIFRNESFK